MAINKDNKNQIIQVGSILMLIGVALSLLIIVNVYFTEKLGGLQVAINNNATRITNIEKFLTEQIQAAQKMQQDKGGAGDQVEPGADSSANK